MQVGQSSVYQSMAVALSPALSHTYCPLKRWLQYDLNHPSHHGSYVQSFVLEGEDHMSAVDALNSTILILILMNVIKWMIYSKQQRNLEAFW